ncbi:hypothetical protein D3C84_884540 [compost metagenome]
MIQHQRNRERAHVGYAMLVTGDEEAEHEQNHGEHLRAVSLKGQGDEESKTDKPVTEDRPEEQFLHGQIHLLIHDAEQEPVNGRLGE